MMKRYILVAAVATSCMAFACNKNESVTTDSTTKPDNTAVNKMDRDTAATTPMDQSESAADIKITADIRRALMDDKVLSTNGQNAKVITNKGAVVLRGVVDSSSERDSIEGKAKSIAGVTSVDNQLTVKNP